MATIYPVTRKSGRAWRAQVRKADGTSTTKTFPTQRDAKQWVVFTEQQIAEGKRIAATRGPLRFGDVTDAYVTAHGGQMGRSKTAGLRLLRRRLGAVKITDMAVGKTYTDFVSSRERDGAGPATILQDLSYLRTVLDGGAVALGLDMSQQLTALVGVRRLLSNAGRVARPQERTRRPTDGELVKLMACWDANPRQEIPMSSIVRFAICSAMRLSEIIGLRWDGMDEAKRTVLIRDRKHPRQKKGNDQVVPLLRGPVTIGGTVVDPMDEISAQRDNGSEFIFPFNPDSVSAAFTRACKKVGIVDLHLHDLRHDGVSRLFEAGLAIEQVALVSGHRDWSMLRRYVQLRGEDLHDVLDGLMERSSGYANVVELQASGTGS